MTHDYNEKLSSIRLRNSSVSRNNKVSEFYSDRSRILFCTSFRRLQQKAQVFSLESNSSVHTRMTHSLEVSDLGRTLANKIARRLYEKGEISLEQVAEIVAIVENACLVHDLGNPPFGHFGESAIQSWAKSTNVFDAVCKKNLYLFQDFKQFDGNPQGIRILLKLHTEKDVFSLNLTSSSILCALKYVRSSCEKSDNGIMKKPGFFITETEEIKQIQKNANVKPHHRYPFTYIMEAADDIAYCMSDIADGIEKRIITLDEFIKSFKSKLNSKIFSFYFPNNINSFTYDVSIPLSNLAMEEVSDYYINNHDDVFNGTTKDLLSNTKIHNTFETLKDVAKEKLYSSPEAENIELAGFSVITGLLKHYECLLILPYVIFKELVEGNQPSDDKKDYKYEKRLYNRIASHYVAAYKTATDKLDKTSPDFHDKELWLRTHLIIDYISGMTDEFSLSMYQLLEGINIKNR